MVFIVPFVACCTNTKPTTASDQTNNQVMTDEDCDMDEYAPVTGADKRCYLNACRAKNTNIKVINKGYDAVNYKLADELTWPIESVCKPIQEEWDSVPPRELGDGTLIYWTKDKKQYRGTYNKCRCLATSTLIDTPEGSKLITDLKVGDLIFSQNFNGERISVAIRMINQVAVDAPHNMLRLTLADGRIVELTPAHPSASRALLTMDQYAVGDDLDGSTVASKEYFDYNESYTYDILPQSETAAYWANGILTGSTLKFAFYTEDLVRLGW